MPFVDAGPVRLEYFERTPSGEASGFTCVLVHGYRSSARIWDVTQAGLATRGVRSIAINNRGAAGSDVTEPDEDYSALSFSRDLAAAVDALGLDRFVLVGHSMGARTVTHFVEQHPERVQALVLMSGGSLRARTEMTAEQRARWDAMVEGYPGNIDGAYWEHEHQGLDPEVRTLLWEDWQRVPPQRMRGVLTAPQDLRPVLAGIEVPTLVMFGDADRTVPPGGSAECYLTLPEAVRHLHVFHGIDHSPSGIVPDEVAAVLARFIEGQVRAGAQVAK